MTHLVQGGWQWCKNFLKLTSNIFFPISPAQWSIKNISKHLFHFIKSSTKIIEFDKVKCPKSISSKNGVWKAILEIDSNSTLSRKWVLQKREFSYPFFQSLSYNNLVVLKQIYFCQHFKSRRFTSLIILQV